MTTSFSQIGNWLLLAGGVVFVVAVFNAARAGRQSRDAAYYGIRQEALNKTRRWSVVAIIALLATGGLAFYLGNQPPPTAIATRNTPTPVIVSVPSKLLPTETPSPSAATQAPATPTALPSPTPLTSPTAVPTALPLATASADLPDVLRTALPSAVTVSPNAKLSFTTLASAVDSKGNPTDPGLVFPSGTRRARLYFQASNVNSGATWSVLCYKGDQLIDSVIDVWRWGPRTQTARAFCSLDGSAGDYTMVAYLGPTKQFEIAFQLLSATPTATP